MSDITIAVLRGGPSSEYAVSLKTGAAIIDALSESYKIIDILIDRQGQWHRNGLPMEPAQALLSADVAVLALHGEYGEDGQVQRLLDELGIPYTGSGAHESALAIHKARTHLTVESLPMIKLPEHHLVREDDGVDYDAIARDVFSRFGPPYIVKPVRGGSSVGLVVAKTIAELPSAIEHVANVSGSQQVLVEQLIQGKEATCGVVEQLRDEAYYTLPPVEVVPPKSKGGLYDYEAKYSNDPGVHAQMICPATFSHEQKLQIQDAAKAVHKALGLQHYSRSDFILAPHGLYFLEVNTLPGLTQQSLIPHSLEAIGSNLKEFLEHITELALNK